MACSASSSWSTRHRVGLDHGVVLVVEIKQVRGDSHAYGVTFAAITVDFHSHDNLLEPVDSPTMPARYDQHTGHVDIVAGPQD